jgi:pimeloyl-ACP methyl ester carboxylesterase
LGFDVLPPMPSARRVALPRGGWLNVHEAAGRGPAVVLLHGLTDCAESFRLLLPHLADCHLVVPDLRGHGASFRSDIADLASLSHDVEAVLRHLGPREVILVGHSMGALVAVHLALRQRIRVAGLATISGSLNPGGPALQALKTRVQALPDPLPLRHPFLDAWYACCRPVPAAFLDRLQASCVEMRREDWLACLDLLETADLRAAARNLRVPSLVLAGSHDEIFSRPHHDALVAALNPSRSLVFDHVGHNPHWEVPGLVAAELRAFVNRVATAGRHDALPGQF